MSGNYWQSALAARVTRRRTLALTAGVAAGAAILGACGGSSSDDGPVQKGSTSLLSEPVDTSKSAKRGGVYKNSINADYQTFDPQVTSIPNSPATTYSRLTTQKAGYLKSSTGEIVGDLAESWEFSPDRLQLTMKIRPDALNAPLPPVNSRAMDAEDVVFSWKRYAAGATQRSTLANAVSPTAPVLSVTATDPRTVVFKLNQVLAPLLGLIGNSNPGNLYILPKEAESGFDARRTPIGSGPWYLSEYVPSARFVYKRNPGYYEKDRPYLDSVEMPIVPEYATGLAQFKAGALWSYAVRGEDILPTKQSQPSLVMQLSDMVVTGYKAFYGMKPAPAEKTPFRDERVRQAFSMAWDRDLWLDAAFNIQKLASQGVNLDVRWNTALRADAFEGWWLDPKGKDFGPNAKFYQHDLAGAKQLLAAAGYANGLDADAHYVTTGEYGIDFNKQVEILLGFAQEAGIRLKTSPVNFNGEWRPGYADAKGNFEGISFRNTPLQGIVDIGEKLFTEYNSKAGVVFTGFDPDGKGTFAGDPKMDDMTNQMRSEFDTKKRIALAWDIQRYNGLKQYNTNFPGGASTLTIASPVLSNTNVYRGELRPFLNEWFDVSKKSG